MLRRLAHQPFYFGLKQFAVMKKTISLFVLLLSIGSTFGQTAPTGIWNTGTDNTKIEIIDINGTLTGTVLSSDNEQAPIGKVLVKNLAADGEVWKGQLFAPKRQEWFDATFEEDGNILEITVGSGFMSRTVEWTRE